MFKSPESRVQTEALPPLDSSSHQLAVLCLNCLSHLFRCEPKSLNTAFSCAVHTPKFADGLGF